ncbi:MAG: elongation factor G [bacterium]|nr:elongation factor G [bacterium]
MAEVTENFNPAHKVCAGRNIGIIAHIDAGKTTTTERMLYYTHCIHKIGEVDEGSATMDWMEEEKERGITITAAAITCYWRGKRINIIDTPGHIDFTGEVERSLRVLDGAIMIFSAVEGVESQSESVWYQADRYQVPRLVYINKLDRIGADPYHCINMIKDRLAGHPLILQLPVGIEESFHGVCDVLSGKLIEWPPGGDGAKFKVSEVPSSLKAQFELAKKDLLEAISIEDDRIGEVYLEGKVVEREELIRAIRRLTIKNRFVPVFFGSSLKNTGVQPLLDGIVDYLPSPIDRRPVEGKNLLTGQIEKLKPDPESPFCALVFKLQTTPHGKLFYLRIYSGKIKPGSVVLNTNTGLKGRISQIFLMYADRQEIIEEASAGDIVAVYGLKESRTGDTISAPGFPIMLEGLKFPEPVISATIEPKTRSDGDKLSIILNKLTIDDPTFKVKTDSDTGEVVVSGMGELHLEVLTQRMEREFSLKTRFTNPRVAYRETITRVVRERGQFIKQSGGRGQYGDVELELKPLERGGGFKFKEKVRDGSIPREYWGAIRKGVEASMKVGVLGGFPIVDLEVVLLGGSYHSIDSSDIAFEMAASIAFKKGMERGKPVLLEPMMRLEIIVPPEYLGAILDDLSTRGGRVLSLSGSEVRHTVIASCPLRKLFGYATVLRSITQGRVVHLMKFDTYQPLPQEEQDLVLKKIRGY